MRKTISIKENGKTFLRITISSFDTAIFNKAITLIIESIFNTLSLGEDLKKFIRKENIIK